MSLGPLNTTYTAAPSCLASLTNIYMTTWSGNRTYLGVGPVTTSGCFPANYIAEPDRYYSPGVCPSLYTSACSSLNRIENLEETVVTCCPQYDDTSLRRQASRADYLRLDP